MAKIGKDESVLFETLGKICVVLVCGIAGIIEIFQKKIKSRFWDIKFSII